MTTQSSASFSIHKWYPLVGHSHDTMITIVVLGKLDRKLLFWMFVYFHSELLTEYAYQPCTMSTRHSVRTTK